MQVQSVAGTGDNPYTNALVAVKWLGSTLTYGFPTQSQYTGYDPGEETSQSFEVLAPAQQDAVRAAFGMISTFTNLTFTELTGADTGNAELRFGQSDAAAVAFAYYPDPSPMGGDAWFNNSFNYFDTPALGNYAFFSFMHEIGHTLGLGHPHESAQPMPADRDWIGYTVMSYRSTQGAGLGYYGSYFPQSYMMEDIRALQLMYGANYGYQAGDTTYTFNPANGELSINGVAQGAPASNRLYRTLWDGGGVDTLDFSTFQGAALLISLRPGTVSQVPQSNGSQMLFMSHLFNGDIRSLIENAVGSLSNDSIYGNAADNTLSGLSGADKLYGESGSDRLFGGSADDQLYGGEGDDWLSGDDGNDELYGESGNDTLTGGTGYDRLDGGIGNDILTASTGGGYLYGRDGDDRLNGSDLFDQLEGGTGADIIQGGGGDDVLLGGDGNDSLSGGAGNDVMDGGTGADAMTGGAGSDTYTLDDPGDTFAELAGDPGSDQVTTAFNVLDSTGIEVIQLTGSGNLTVLGNGAANTILGNSGNNIIDGGTGADTMSGGLGDDVFYVDNGGDRVGDTGGRDTIYSLVSFVLPTLTSGTDPYSGASYTPPAPSQPYYPIEVLVLTGSAAINATGTAGAEELAGNGAANIIDGGAGADLLTGNGGADELWGGADADRFLYLADTDSTDTASDWLRDFQHGVDKIDVIALSPVAIDFAGQGAGQTWSTATLTLANGHTLVLRITGEVNADDFLHGGTLSTVPPQTVLGTDANDNLTGGDGNDTLIGYGGNDTMAGGKGNDSYFVDSGEDIIVEGNAAGFDRIASATTYFLRAGAELEVLEPVTFNATDPINFFGNEFTNLLRGNNGSNLLDGGSGNDTLHGQAGNDFLNGGLGADAMYGGLGDDTYYVDDAGDRIFEESGQGYDRVAPGIDFTAPDVAEIELIEAITLSATTALNLGGTNSANTIFGNQGVNILRGFGGADVLHGLGGNDYLDGGTGADAMYGGAGDDTYYVDNVDDRVFENAGEGIDRVAARTDYFGSGSSAIEIIERLNRDSPFGSILHGNDIANTVGGAEGDDWLYGHEGDDTMYGYGGNDRMWGGTGADTLYGGRGDDLYYLEEADRFVELVGEGTDTILVNTSYALQTDSELENATVLNESGQVAMNLTGNQYANTLTGNDGSNVLDGKLGSDILAGKFGNDIFAFTTPLSASNVDTIADFVTFQDKIALDHAIFTRFNPGTLDPAFFRVGSAAQDGDDFIIYNSATGALYYDPDGNGAGAAVQFASLPLNLPMASSNFLIL